MNKKFLSAILFGALMVSSTGTFVSCKDYDDDIKNLQDQIDKLVTPETLNSKITELQTAITEAKTSAASELAAAKTALQNAIDAKADASAITSLENTVKACENRVSTLDSKLQSLETTLDNYKTELVDLIADKADQKDLDALDAKLDTLKSDLTGVIGKRLTSVTLVPSQYINGIPALVFKSVSYNEVIGYNEDGSPKKAETVTIASDEKATASFRLSPSLGVTLADIDAANMIFDVMSATNTETRAAGAPQIAPVAGTAKIENGKLVFNVKKTTTGSVASSQETTDNTIEESFYQAALNVPIAEKNWAEGESSSNIPTVWSEYFRLDETTITPVIKKAESLGSEWDAHYKDSVAVYKSGISADYTQTNLDAALVSYTVAHDKTFDLKKVVDVCSDPTSHSSVDYKSFGLTFRFAVASKAYLKGTNNNTDQQQFAKIDNATNGHLTSKVYTINNQSYAAIGREPIIRVELVDTVNNKLVDRKYLKIKFAESVVEPTSLPTYTFVNDTVRCENIVQVFGTARMNEDIYDALKISKENFHANYADPVITTLTKTIAGAETDLLATTAGLAAGTDYSFIQRKDPENTDSYNLVWTMSPKAIGSVVPATSAKYSVTVKWAANNNSSYGDIVKTFTYTVIVPAQKFNYQGTYWKDGVGSGTFNVNPVVYNATTFGTTSVDYINGSHISADLINGYIYATKELKPANVYELFTNYAKAGECVTGEIVFDQSKFANYSYLAGYTVSSDETQLLKGTEVAAEIHNDIDNGAADSYIHLMENSVTDANFEGGNLVKGTEGVASALQFATEGTNVVPVKVYAVYNEYNKVAVDEFAVRFIQPMTVDGTIDGTLEDAVVSGSFVDVAKGLTFTDWNGYSVAKVVSDATQEKTKYAAVLYDYYGVKSVIWDTENVKTNLKLVGDTYTPTEGVKNGNLPTGNSLKPVTKNADGSYTVQAPGYNNPDCLGYYNNNGTPVNVAYKLYVDVVITYKWGEIKKEAVEITVNPAGGIK